MKHITYHVEVHTLTGWNTIYSDPCYVICQVFALALRKYTVNPVRIINPALSYDERMK